MTHRKAEYFVIFPGKRLAKAAISPNIYSSEEKERLSMVGGKGTSGSRGQRQRHIKNAAPLILSERKLRPEAAILARNQIAAEVEAQAQPRKLALGAVFWTTIERGEELHTLFMGHARPIIAHRNERRHVLIRRPLALGVCRSRWLREQVR